MYSCQWFKDIFTDYVRNLAQHLAFNRIRVAVAIKKLHPYTTNQKKNALILKNVKNMKYTHCRKKKH